MSAEQNKALARGAIRIWSTGADLSGLPPLLMTVGGDEALLDDSVRFLRAAGTAEVDVTLSIGANMQHIYPIYCGAMPEADAAVAMIGTWIRAYLS